jgi:peptidase E
MYLGIVLEYFRDKDINFREVKVIDYEVTPVKALSLIEKADVVWLSGGPTLVQIRCIKEYGLISALQKRNGITIGMSAGSINMAKKVVLAKDLADNVPDLSVYDGIGLVNFNIEPHLNTASKEHLNDVEIAAKVSPIYGLYDNAFIEDIDGEFKVYGKFKLFM